MCILHIYHLFTDTVENIYFTGRSINVLLLTNCMRHRNGNEVNKTFCGLARDMDWLFGPIGNQGN